MYVNNSNDNTVSVINLCPRPAELSQQLPNTNRIVMTTANNNNDPFIKNTMPQKNIGGLNNKTIQEDEEIQKLAVEQKIQKNNIMSPPSIPRLHYH